MKVTLAFFFTIVVSFGWAQGFTDKSKYSIGLRGEYGYILNHSETMEYITGQHFPTFELYIEKQTDGSKDWHNAYHLPKWGIAFFTADINEYFGKIYTLHPYIAFPIKRGNFADLDFRLGAGIGYVSNPFERVKNFKNVAIGTHLNATFSFMLDAAIHLCDPLKLHTNLTFTHFSNSSYAKPNLGINIPTIGLGLSYHYGNSKTVEQLKRTSFKKDQQKWRYTIRGAMGVNETYVEVDRKFYAGSFSFLAQKQTSEKSKWGGEFNLFHNPALRKELDELNKEVNGSLGITQLGLGISHTLMIDRFGLYLQAGAYIHSAYKEEGILFQRVGGVYQFSDKISGQLLLKTHLAVAEYLEFGLGYTL
jgi:hypothetical protein